MNNKLVFEKLFNSSFNDSRNKPLLEQIANEHPYFSPAQFFLLHRSDPQSPAYKRQAGITSIFFNNPHWLNFQLQQTNGPAEVVEAPLLQTIN